MVTAYPELAFGAETRFHYFLVQFPVGALGVLFDSLSFFATIYIVRRAVASSTTFSYLGHLSIDLVVAAAATCWVLFVFSFSGWIIGNYEKSMAAQKAAVVSTNVAPEPKAVDTLAVRNQIYQKKGTYIFGLIAFRRIMTVEPLEYKRLTSYFKSRPFKRVSETRAFPGLFSFLSVP